jgi:hypothetical protein
MLAFKLSVLNVTILKRENNIEQVKYITEEFLLEKLLVVHLISKFYRPLWNPNIHRSIVNNEREDAA